MVNQFHLIDVYRAFYPTTAEYTFSVVCIMLSSVLYFSLCFGLVILYWSVFEFPNPVFCRELCYLAYPVESYSRIMYFSRMPFHRAFSRMLFYRFSFPVQSLHVFMFPVHLFPYFLYHFNHSCFKVLDW